MRTNTKIIELSNGIRLPYVEQGSQDGVPVIFLHGVTDSHRSFDLLLPLLPQSLRAFALTQRGHGDASKPKYGYLSHNMAEDLGLFMDEAGIDSAVIVGHSMGSFVAQRFAIDNPSRVRKLVLIGSFATCRGNTGVEEFFSQAVDTLTDPVSEEFVAEFQTSTISNGVSNEFLKTIIGESLKVPAHVWKAACRGMIDVDHTPELYKIDAETLLIWGERDAYFSRADQTQLLEEIRNSRLKIYPEIGHSPNWEAPERLAADIVSIASSAKLAERLSLEYV